MLEVNNLHVYYGSIHAIKGISFNVNEGEIISLIGANGAGKTTTLHAITGLIPAKEGKVAFLSETFFNNNDKKSSIFSKNTSIAPYEIIHRKMAHVPEGRRVFSKLTVAENLMLGAFTLKDKALIAENYENILEMFPRLREREKQIAGTLSGGEQQMLAIGRAIMSNPKLLIMDEPSMGLAPLLVEEIFNIIERCNKAGMTILLVEQNASLALKISHRAYVLETGNIVLSGSGKELLDNEDVKKAYLGG